jgi:hypothetical protein
LGVADAAAVTQHDASRVENGAIAAFLVAEPDALAVAGP